LGVLFISITFIFNYGYNSYKDREITIKKIYTPLSSIFKSINRELRLKFQTLCRDILNIFFIIEFADKYYIRYTKHAQERFEDINTIYELFGEVVSSSQLGS